MTEAVPPPTAKPKLSGIEALRGVAALAVLIYHAARHVDAAYGMPVLMRVFQAGHAGVDLFFVLSGFLILHVHRRDIGRADRIGHYARQRFTRVMPLYWIALTLTIAKLAAGGHGFPNVETAFRSFFLLPGWEEPLLGPAWSLQHELLFYLIFAVLLLNRTSGIILLCLWGALVMSGLGGIWDETLPFQIVGHYNLEFFLGMAVALAVPYLRQGTGLALAGSVTFVAAGVAESLGWLDGLGAVARLCYGLPSALLIAGLVVMSQRPDGLRLPPVLNRLGGASYSLYLFQFLFMGLAVKLWERIGLDRADMAPLLFLLMVIAGLAGGLIVEALVEKPLLRWMRRSAQAQQKRPALGLIRSRLSQE